MAKRPLPNVDPQALSELASRYPSSGGAARSADAGAAAKPEEATANSVPTEGPTARAETTSPPPPSPSVGAASKPAVRQTEAPRTSGPIGGGSRRPSPAPPPAPSRVERVEVRRKGGWGTVFLAFVFMVIGLAAAVVSVAGPSLREDMRAFLGDRFPDADMAMLDRLTGQAPQRLEVTYAGLDERIATLEALAQRIAAGGEIPSSALRDLVTGADAARRIEEVGSRVADAESSLSRLRTDLSGLSDASGAASSDIADAASRVASLEDRLDALDQTLSQQAESIAANSGAVETLTTGAAATASSLTAVEGRLAPLETAGAENAATLDTLTAGMAAAETERSQLTSDLAAANEAASSLTERTDAVEAAAASTANDVASLTDAVASARNDIDASADKITAVDAALASANDALKAAGETSAATTATLADVSKRMAAVETTVDDARTVTRDVNLPILAALRLRAALDTASPFAVELSDLQSSVAGGGSMGGSFEVLDAHAKVGVPTVADLRQSFAFLISQTSGPITRLESWADRVASWFEALVGTTATPVASPAGRLSATIASIDAALEVGQLDLAIEEVGLLATRSPDPLLDGWLVQARARRDVERALADISQRLGSRLRAEAQ